MKPLQVVTWKKNSVTIIDQTKLPGQLVYCRLDTMATLWEAIKMLKVRGAPAIGIAGALGVVLAADRFLGNDIRRCHDFLKQQIAYLASARPTAVNLFWALARMDACRKSYQGVSVKALRHILLKEAMAILEEDKKICRTIGVYGQALIKSGDQILTHCNAGALATADYGTALGVIYSACAHKKKVKVYCDETRPLWQGARLSAWELMHHRIDTTVICDNMAASLMEKGCIDKVIVGADRITANGDTANKIGTYNVAILASYHKIPFYVAAPLSTFDFSLKSGAQIPIEQRNPDEVVNPYGIRIAPKGINVYNPAFDVTPAKLITAFITEYGVFKPAHINKIR